MIVNDNYEYDDGEYNMNMMMMVIMMIMMIVCGDKKRR